MTLKLKCFQYWQEQRIGHEEDRENYVNQEEL